jgi:hypothetical protein
MKKSIIGIYLLLAFIFASCLPQEKTTQCASNEAYNATTRSCVATLGASSSTINISNVTPSASYAINNADTSKTHTITVFDPYNNGYSVQWKLTQPNGSIILQGTGLSLTFNHKGYPSGSYILEVQLFDSAGATLFDSRSWTVNIITDEIPTLTRVSPSTPFSTSTTNSPSLLQTTLTNPDGLAVFYQWYVNGVAQSITTTSFSFDPTDSATYHFGAGIYSVEVVVSDVTATVYDSLSWTISNNIPSFAAVSLGISPTHGSTTPNDATKITAIVDTPILTANSFLNDTNGDNLDFCVQVNEDDADTVNVAGVDGNNVYVEFVADGVPVATTQITTENTPVCLGEYLDSLSVAYQVSIAGLTQYFEGMTLKAVVYDGYTGASNYPTYNNGTQIQAYTWNITKRKKNTPPEITIDTTKSTLQYDCDLNGVADGTTSCAGSTTVSEINGIITENTSFDVAITIKDDDTTDPDSFGIDFEVDNSNLDGSNVVSSSICNYTTADTVSTTEYVCSLTINSFTTTTGPIDPSTASYTVTAKVSDTTGAYGGTSLESNEVSWTISKVIETNTQNLILPYDGVTAGLTTASTTNSFIAKQTNSGVSINTTAVDLTEGDAIQFAVNVQDIESDSHVITVNKCTDITCGTVGSTIISKVITSTDTSVSLTRMSLLNYVISEDDVTGATSDTVYYQVSVTDTPSDAGTTSYNAVPVVFSALIQNNNPLPTFDTTASPAVATILKAYTGFPFTIDPGTITDASTNDGDIIEYQWMLSTNAGTNWLKIDGATSKILTWIPASKLDFTTQIGAPVKIKLCIGDDGFSNDVQDGAGTDCSAVALDSSNAANFGNTWDLSVYSNMGYGEDPVTNDGNGEIAVWVDPSSAGAADPTVKYMVYQSTSNQIVVEKIVTNTNSTKSGSNSQISSIAFDTTSTAATAATHLSVTGDPVGKALYISYMAPYAGASGADSLHVRRIDISGGKVGLTHDGKFGFDESYDGLAGTEITVDSTELSSEVVNANGLIEITANSINASNSSITFTAINNGTNVTLTEGAEFCTGSCSTTTEMADAIVDAINNSAEITLQGLTASQSSNVILLSGIAQDDFIQENINANSIGKIMVNQTTGKWEIPYIDNSQSGADKNTISVAYGDLATRLSQSNFLKVTLKSQTDPAQEITNTLDGNDRIILVTRAYSTGETLVYDIASTAGPSYNVATSSSDYFGSTNISDLKVAVGRTTANTSAYIVGKNNADGEIAFGEIIFNGATYNISASLPTTDLNSSYQMFKTDTVYFDISAGANANELFIGQVNDTSNSLFVLKVSGSTPQINCNSDNSSTVTCQSINTVGTAIASSAPVAMSDVLESKTIGDDGATTGENTKDIIVFAFHEDVAAKKLPTLAIINVEGTSSTADAAGTSHNTTYNIPYVSN